MHLSRVYFSTLQIVFVHFADIICPNCTNYLSRLGKERELPLTPCHQTFIWLELKWHLSKVYFSELKIVFVHFANIISPNCTNYLSRLEKERELPLTLCHQNFMWLTLKIAFVRSVFLQIIIVFFHFANIICQNCKHYFSREGERASSDPLPSNFHVAFHTFTLLSPNIKSTLITWNFCYTFFPYKNQHNFCVDFFNNNKMIPSNCYKTQFLRRINFLFLLEIPVISITSLLRTLTSWLV